MTQVIYLTTYREYGAHDEDGALIYEATVEEFETEWDARDRASELTQHSERLNTYTLTVDGEVQEHSS